MKDGLAEARDALVIENGPIRIKRARHGLMAYPINDSFVGRSIDVYGEWSPGDAEILAPYLAPGMTVLDIGANIGALTLFLAHAVGRSGRVLAFEPVRASMRLLRVNIGLNDLPQVEAFETAVGAKPGSACVPELDLRAAGNYGAAALGEGREVDVISIDDLDLAACDLIKADVEGHEGAVIEGARRTIARFRPILFLENEEPTLSPLLIEALLTHDYRLWWHSPPLYRADNWFGRADNLFPGLGSLNLLCVPAERNDDPVGLKSVEHARDWPAWWPDWSAQ